MFVDEEIQNELIEDAGEARAFRARTYQKEGKVHIKDYFYDSPRNFSVHSIVDGNFDDYKVYIEVQNGEIENVECECEDYLSHYGACKHIIATLLEFVKLKDTKTEKKLLKGNKENLKYNNFKEMINTFYQDFVNEIENPEKKYGKEYGNIYIVPKIIIDTYNIETILAEKMETILTRGKYNSRMKDYYDIYFFLTKLKNEIDKNIFRKALKNTISCVKKKSNLKH